MTKKKEEEAVMEKTAPEKTAPEITFDAAAKELLAFYTQAMELARQRGTWSFEESGTIAQALTKTQELLKED